MDFTIDDLNVLMEAMEAWENKDTAGELMGSLLTAMLAPHDTDEQKANLQREQDEARLRATDAKNMRKERSILLRAKLIQMLDSARAGVLTSDLPHA